MSVPAVNETMHRAVEGANYNKLSGTINYFVFSRMAIDHSII